jgi:AraC-like DNA-binding protein
MNALYKSIVDAMNKLALGEPVKTNGRLTALNLATEAGISRATLYRQFDEYPDLGESFGKLKRNQTALDDVPPLSVHDALDDSQKEVKALRVELAAERKKHDQIDKQRLHQIALLWSANQLLEKQISSRKSQDR